MGFNALGKSKRWAAISGPYPESCEQKQKNSAFRGPARCFLSAFTCSIHLTKLMHPLKLGYFFITNKRSFFSVRHIEGSNNILYVPLFSIPKGPYDIISYDTCYEVPLRTIVLERTNLSVFGSHELVTPPILRSISCLSWHLHSSWQVHYLFHTNCT